MKRYKNKVRRNAESEEMTLNITALADIFVILLVFMLKSYSSGLQIMTSQAMTLPKGLNQDLGEFEALKIEVSQDAIFVDSVLVEDLTKDSTRDYTGLTAAVKEKIQKQDWLKNQGAEVKNPAEFILLADQDVPYWMIKKVLVTTTMEGMIHAKLAVVQE